VLPLTIKGPLESPTYGVDLQSITRVAARTQALEELSKQSSPLGQLAAGLLGKKGGEVESPAAESGPRPSLPSAEVPGSAPVGDQAIRVTSRKYEGNFLFPSLTIRGEFASVGITRADLMVEGKGGQPVLQKIDAFQEIGAYYAAHDRAQLARIPFKFKIDGKSIAGAGDLKITITLHRSDGTTSVQTFTQPKHSL
jgi:hypothetical protein